MIIEIEINGARVQISGDNLSVSVVDENSGKTTSAPQATAFPLPGHIVTLTDVYAAKTGLAPSTISISIFNDGKRVDRLRSGVGITVQSYNDAIRWFDEHWHFGWNWPHGVPRPKTGENAA